MRPVPAARPPLHGNVHTDFDGEPDRPQLLDLGVREHLGGRAGAATKAGGTFLAHTTTGSTGQLTGQFAALFPQVPRPLHIQPQVRCGVEQPGQLQGRDPHRIRIELYYRSDKCA